MSTNPNDWIGTRWRACCQMVIPKGPLAIGDTFTFDAKCAALGLRPDQWIAAGNAERLAEPIPLSASVEARAARPARGGRPGRPPVELPVEPAPEPAADDASAGKTEGAE